MNSKKSSTQYIYDMYTYTEKALVFTKGYNEETYFDDDYRAEALKHAIQIIGEAASKVDSSTRLTLNTIPWTKIISTRNLIVHNYEKIDEPIIWNIVIDHLPSLRQNLLDHLQQQGIEL